ncbi:hypothetical protein M9H77_08714 [Catharanthus roseus]|uniref:Uncharacterized protein n=1 Tax=Catharanthus roseus TaxID=4058 RepID=A0ACC0BYK1_CATRO|nr:hypothetical protein M9H77_08714 [Catharanthus roseus]
MDIHGHIRHGGQEPYKHTGGSSGRKWANNLHSMNCILLLQPKNRSPKPDIVPSIANMTHSSKMDVTCSIRFQLRRFKIVGKLRALVTSLLKTPRTGLSVLKVVQLARIKQGNILEEKMSKFWHAAALSLTVAPSLQSLASYYWQHLGQTRPLSSAIGSTLPSPERVKPLNVKFMRLVPHRFSIRVWSYKIRNRE